MAITGTVKWFNAEEGYGFISRKDGFKDVFVQQSAIQMAGETSLDQGLLVEFDIGPAVGGQEARNVHPI